MEILIPEYRRNPNEMIRSVYSGVAPGNRTVTRIVKVAPDRNHLEATSVYGPALPRGVGGRVGVLVLGGLVTTLDEMEYIIAAKQEKKFQPRRSPKDIADMCRMVQERRNEQIRYFRRNPSEAPKKKRTVRLHLPVGYRYVPTREPGLSVLARV